MNTALPVMSLGLLGQLGAATAPDPLAPATGDEKRAFGDALAAVLEEDANAASDEEESEDTLALSPPPPPPVPQLPPAVLLARLAGVPAVDVTTAAAPVSLAGPAAPAAPPDAPAPSTSSTAQGPAATATRADTEATATSAEGRTARPADASSTRTRTRTSSTEDGGGVTEPTKIADANEVETARDGAFISAGPTMPATKPQGSFAASASVNTIESFLSSVALELPPTISATATPAGTPVKLTATPEPEEEATPPKTKEVAKAEPNATLDPAATTEAPPEATAKPEVIATTPHASASAPKAPAEPARVGPKAKKVVAESVESLEKPVSPEAMPAVAPPVVAPVPTPAPAGAHVKTVTNDQGAIAPRDAEENVRAAEALGHKRVLAAGEASGHVFVPELGRIEVRALTDEKANVDVRVHIDDVHGRAVLAAHQPELRAHVQAEVPQAQVTVERQPQPTLENAFQQGNTASREHSHREQGERRGRDEQGGTVMEPITRSAVRGRARFVL